MYPDLAAIVTAAVMGMMFYFGPWADPPGMDELWWLLTTAAVILASWRWWGTPTSYLITRVSIIAVVSALEPRSRVVRQTAQDDQVDLSVVGVASTTQGPLLYELGLTGSGQ